MVMFGSSSGGICYSNDRSECWQKQAARWVLTLKDSVPFRNVWDAVVDAAVI